MNYFLETLEKVQSATWIAITSLVVSIIALFNSSRHQSFEIRLAGAKKATEIRSLFLEYKRTIDEFLKCVNAWDKICQECELCPEDSFTQFRKDAETFRKVADLYLETLNSPVTKATAIRLEPITAYGDDLCKRLSKATELCHKATKLAEDCQTKKRESSE